MPEDNQKNSTQDLSKLKIVISEETWIKLQEYKDKASQKEGEPTPVIKEIASSYAKDKNIKTKKDPHEIIKEMSPTEFLRYFTATKRPTEGMTSANYQYTKKESSLMNGIQLSIDVEAYNNGKRQEQKAIEEKNGLRRPTRLYFVQGAHFGPTPKESTPQLSALTSDDLLIRFKENDGELQYQWDDEAFIQRTHDFLYPLFFDINNDAKKEGKKAIIRIPGIGCGLFAGSEPVADVQTKLHKSIEEFLKKNAHKFPEIELIEEDFYRTTGNEIVQNGEKQVYENIALVGTHRGNKTGELKIPEAMENPATFDSQKNKYYVLVAGNPYAFPGNCGNIGTNPVLSSRTDDDTMFFATNLPEKLIRLMREANPVAFAEACKEQKIDPNAELKMVKEQHKNDYSFYGLKAGNDKSVNVSTFTNKNRNGLYGKIFTDPNLAEIVVYDKEGKEVVSSATEKSILELTNSLSELKTESLAEEIKEFSKKEKQFHELSQETQFEILRNNNKYKATNKLIMEELEKELAQSPQSSQEEGCASLFVEEQNKIKDQDMLMELKKYPTALVSLLLKKSQESEKEINEKRKDVLKKALESKKDGVIKNAKLMYKILKEFGQEKDSGFIKSFVANLEMFFKLFVGLTKSIFQDPSKVTYELTKKELEDLTKHNEKESKDIFATKIANKIKNIYKYISNDMESEEHIAFLQAVIKLENIAAKMFSPQEGEKKLTIKVIRELPEQQEQQAENQDEKEKNNGIIAIEFSDQNEKIAHIPLTQKDVKEMQEKREEYSDEQLALLISGVMSAIKTNKPSEIVIPVQNSKEKTKEETKKEETKEKKAKKEEVKPSTTLDDAKKEKTKQPIRACA